MENIQSIFTDVNIIDSERHPRLKDDFIAYGTAGFRTESKALDHVMYRTGILASLRSKALNGATVGLMLTASHNPECDNGVKLVDPKGEMLAVAWEKYATLLANTPDKLSDVLNGIIGNESIDMNIPCSVAVARDTRPSGKALSEAAIDGVRVLGAKVTDYGLLTTPQLHYIVRCTNDPMYGQPTEPGYYAKLSRPFLQLNKNKDCSNYSAQLTVDCANGIGAPKLKRMAGEVSELLDIKICNDSTEGRLNHECGADYVKVKQCSPRGITAECGRTFVTFDGDADRILYFFFDSELKFHLLDGDRIAILIASYLLELIRKSGVPLKLGVVQTAYANGNSTTYITNTLGVEVSCVSTGVKHLHHSAQQFDVGVYFEANGHGTVLFSDHAHTLLHCPVSTHSSTDDQKEAVATLCHLMDLINQTVGDAMSDMLLVETILRSRDMSLPQWYLQYCDLPNRQLKVKVQDRNVVTTTDAERRVVTPEGLQAAIDVVVAGYRDGRSFVRASGTEDVVRVYAEAHTQEKADELAREVCRLVYSLAGGVGDLP